MNPFIGTLGVLLVIVSFVTAQTTEDGDTNINNDSCALYGGKCSSACPGGYDMNLWDGFILCDTGRNSICCNPHKETCKSRGGECTTCTDFPPGRKWDDAQDCNALGRQCCIHTK